MAHHVCELPAILLQITVKSHGSQVSNCNGSDNVMAVEWTILPTMPKKFVTEFDYKMLLVKVNF